MKVSKSHPSSHQSKVKEHNDSRAEHQILGDIRE